MVCHRCKSQLFGRGCPQQCVGKDSEVASEFSGKVCCSPLAMSVPGLAEGGQALCDISVIPAANPRHSQVANSWVSLLQRSPACSKTCSSGYFVHGLDWAPMPLVSGKKKSLC